MEKDLLTMATERLSANLGAGFSVNIESGTLTDKDNEHYLLVSYHGKEQAWPILVCDRLSIGFLQQHRYLLESRKPCIITDYISKPLKSHLKSKAISYVDAAGNAFLYNGNGLLLHVETNKTERIKKAQGNRAFTKSGLKVVFLFLANEDILNLPYRTIAGLADVSIDTVGKTIKGLLKDHYLHQSSSRQYQIADTGRLLRDWTLFFNKILRPKLKQRRFAFKNSNSYSSSLLEKAEGKYTVGGAAAAAHLTNYLIAEEAILYTSSSFVDLAKSLELIPKENGEILMTEQFWIDQADYLPSKATVSPVLIYADLLLSPSPRNTDTAQIVYDQYVI